MIATIIFCLCLFVAIWFTALVCIRVHYKQDISWQLWVFSASWTGVITHLTHIW